MEEGAEVMQQGLGLQRIDPDNGEVSAEYETEAQSLSMDVAGGRLFLHEWKRIEESPYTSEWTEVVDAKNFTKVNLLTGKAVAVARRLDGAPVLLFTSQLANGQTELGSIGPRNV